MTNKQLKSCSPTLVMIEMQIKTTHKLKSIRMAKIKKTENIKC